MTFTLLAVKFKGTQSGNVNTTQAALYTKGDSHTKPGREENVLILQRSESEQLVLV